MLFASSDKSTLVHFTVDLLHNQVLMGVLMAWIVAVIAKAFVSLVAYHRLSLENFIGTGGMPSTHTSPVAAMVLMVGLRTGFDSELFTVALVLLIVVMYDASGIRRAAGRHARAINMIFKSLVEFEQINAAQLIELRELLGHEPIEVFRGALIGILTAFYVYAGGYFTH